MIRPYTDRDADVMVDIWRKASEYAHPFLSCDFLDAEAGNVRNVYPNYAEIWMKEIDTIPVGFIALIGSEVGAIFLDPAHHGKGLGREMMDFAVAQRGALTLDVFKANSVGRAFYKRYGFRQVGAYFHESSGQDTLKLSFTPGSL